ARCLRRHARPPGPAVRAGGRGPPGAGGARGLDDDPGEGRVAEPPRPVQPARGRAAGGEDADDPGLRRGRHRRGRQRGRRPRGDLQPRLAGRRDAGPQALAALGGPSGNARRAGRRPEAEPAAQAGRPLLRRGRLPAHRLAHRLPDALRPVRPPAGSDGAGAGRERWRGDGADRARPGRWLPDVGDRAQRGQARRCPRARRGPGVRDRRAAARAGGRRHGDRRRGDLVPQRQVAQARRRAGHVRGDHRLQPRRRAQPDLLHPAVGRRLHDGHPGGARVADPALQRHRRPPADRRRAAAQRGPRGLRAHARGPYGREDRLHRL
ncbi:MAG: Alcohol dehydrogenase, partial [uncultured Blastococcus sp.]